MIVPSIFCVAYDVASSRDLEGQHGQPTDGVLPSAGETERGVDEAANVHAESAVDWVQDGHFSERLHHEVSRVASQSSEPSIGC